MISFNKFKLMVGECKNYLSDLSYLYQTLYGGLGNAKKDEVRLITLEEDN